jgi:hydrogenase nickel incorporation protein HypA/HybF
MHEFSLINDLLHKIDTIAREQQANRVVGVRVQLGALSHISSDHLREHFVEAAKGTIAGGANLEIVMLTDESDPRAQEILLESIDVE